MKKSLKLLHLFRKYKFQIQRKLVIFFFGFNSFTIQNYVEIYSLNKTLIIFYPKAGSNKLREIILFSGGIKISNKNDFYKHSKCHIFVRNHFDRILSAYYDKVCSDHHYDSKGRKYTEGILEQFGQRSSFKYFFERIIIGKTKDEHILSYSDLHKITGIPNLSQIQKKMETTVFTLNEAKKGLKLSGIDSNLIYQKFLNKTHHSASYKVGNSNFEIVDQPYNLNYTFWLNNEEKYPAKYMFNKYMVEELIRKYYEDIIYKETILFLDFLDK